MHSKPIVLSKCLFFITVFFFFVDGVKSKSVFLTDFSYYSKLVEMLSEELQENEDQLRFEKHSADLINVTLLSEGVEESYPGFCGIKGPVSRDNFLKMLKLGNFSRDGKLSFIEKHCNSRIYYSINEGKMLIISQVKSFPVQQENLLGDVFVEKIIDSSELAQFVERANEFAKNYQWE